MRLIQRATVVLIGMVFFFSGIVVSAQTQEKKPQEKPVTAKPPAKPITIGKEKNKCDTQTVNKTTVSKVDSKPIVKKKIVKKKRYSKKSNTKAKAAAIRRFRQRQISLRQGEVNLKTEKQKLAIREKNVAGQLAANVKKQAEIKGREEAVKLLETKLNTKGGELDARAKDLAEKEQAYIEKVAASTNSEDKTGSNLIVALIILAAAGIGFVTGRKTAPKGGNYDYTLRYPEVQEAPPVVEKAKEVDEVEETQFTPSRKNYNIPDETALKS